MDYGYIQDVEIEFINNDEIYLSDKVRARNASNDDIELLEKIEELEDKIVENQTTSSTKLNSSTLISNTDLNNLLDNLFVK